MPPERYPRRILIAVTGLSPQIVTETVYWLAVERAPVFTPTEVHLITTAKGARRAELELLHPETGWFHRLRADYRLPSITFGTEQIHALQDASGRPLSDIRTPADNTCAADSITAVVRELTQDNDCALHVSIAGGRKTMGFYLGYALSLYGREQDRLSHVLVNAPYESHPQFFYPTTRSHVIYTRGPDEQPFDTQDAEVTVADIPFVRLREGLDDDLLEGRASFSSVVAEAQRAVPPVHLVLNPADCIVTAGGESLAMKPRLVAFYWMLAERARQGRPGIHWSEDGVAGELLGYYGRVVNPNSAEYERAEDTLGRKLTGENISPDKSHINRQLEQSLGRRRAAPYLIVQTERVPGTRYNRLGLTLSPEAIRITGDRVAGRT